LFRADRDFAGKLRIAQLRATASHAANGASRRKATCRSCHVTRCIDCHTLPAIKDHPSAEWPGLVKRMAKRADLKPKEYDAIVAYILAAKQY
jgi:hypothetical protein